MKSLLLATLVLFLGCSSGPQRLPALPADTGGPYLLGAGDSLKINVFGDTGRAGYTLDLTRAQTQPLGVNTLAQYFTRPDYYSAPRQVLLGAALSF